MHRVVLDTKTLVRGLAVHSAAAAKVLRLAEARRAIPLLSKAVLDEYRAVLTDPALVKKFPEITPALVEMTLYRLRFVGDYVRSPADTFPYRRDPRDQKFIELAISLEATHIVSYDADLLSLPHSRFEAGRRFRQRLPGIMVTDAKGFLGEYAGHE